MKFIYHGPLSGITLGGKAGDVVLIDGREYELPEKHSDVSRMQQQGHLTALAADMPAVEEKGGGNGS